MRILSGDENIMISGAGHPRITPSTRLLSNEYGMDAMGEFYDYIGENYGSIPLLGALPADFVADMAELYYRSRSYEDAFWRNAANGAVTLALMAASGAAGYGMAKYR